MQLLRSRPFALVYLLALVAIATVVMACSSSGDHAHSEAHTGTHAMI